MSEENKAIFRRITEEVFGKGNLAVVDELVAADYVDHSPAPCVEPNIEGFKQMATMFRSAFPDLQVTIEDLIAEGDKVAGHVSARGTHRGEMMGIAPTGKEITISEMHILRIANGKAVEHWGVEDNLGLMQQLGVIPS